MSLAANARVESSANGSAAGLIIVAAAHVSPAAGETALDPLVEAMPAGFVNPITKKTTREITEASGQARPGFKLSVGMRFDIMSAILRSKKSIGHKAHNRINWRRNVLTC